MEEEFYSQLQADPSVKKSAFENNWPYILQATRNGLFVDKGEDFIIYHTKRYPNDESSDNVIVNFLGAGKREAVLAFVKRELEKGIKTIIKNIDKIELDWWLDHGFQETTEPWSKYSFRDDNSFPQYNITRASIEGHKFGRHVRRRVRWFDRKRKIVTELYDDKNDQKALDLLSKFATYSENKFNDFAEEVKRGHLFFFDTSIQHKLRLQHVEGEELLGFSFLTPAGNSVFYNAMICKNETNLMRYLLHKGYEFAAAYYPQAEVFGLQGSEKPGQDLFKQRFYPSEIIEKTHIIYQ
jgi:hypothetical protein